MAIDRVQWCYSSAREITILDKKLIPLAMSSARGIQIEKPYPHSIMDGLNIVGDSKRRKQLDPSYGKGFGKKTERRFTVEILSPVLNSYVNVKVVDTKKSLISIAQYHLYSKNRKAYAEAVFQNITDYDESLWVGEHINEISKLICAEVLRNTQVLIVEDN